MDAIREGMEAVLKRLSSMLNLDLDLAALQTVADAIEHRLDEVIAKRPELAEHIGNLESNYDQEVFDDDMDDLKGWAQAAGDSPGLSRASDGSKFERGTVCSHVNEF